MEMIPNFTQIPNILLDELLPDLSKGELKVLLYIARRTYGFHKVKDKISLSQLENGIDGYDKGTGLNRDTIIVSVNRLEEINLLQVDRTKQINEYAINLSFTSRENQLVGLTDQTSRKNHTKLVGKTDTQKKRNKEQKKVGDFDSFDEETKKWLNKEAWNDWVEHRREKKNTLTERSVKMQIKLLAEHKKDHVRIIERSITNGWIGLFPEEKKGYQKEVSKPIRRLTPTERDELMDKRYQEIIKSNNLKKMPNAD